MGLQGNIDGPPTGSQDSPGEGNGSAAKEPPRLGAQAKATERKATGIESVEQDFLKLIELFTEERRMLREERHSMEVRLLGRIADEEKQLKREFETSLAAERARTRALMDEKLANAQQSVLPKAVRSARRGRFSPRAVVLSGVLAAVVVGICGSESLGPELVRVDLSRAEMDLEPNPALVYPRTPGSFLLSTGVLPFPTPEPISLDRMADAIVARKPTPKRGIDLVLAKAEILGAKLRLGESGADAARTIMKAEFVPRSHRGHTLRGFLRQLENSGATPTMLELGFDGKLTRADILSLVGPPERELAEAAPPSETTAQFELPKERMETVEYFPGATNLERTGEELSWLDYDWARLGFSERDDRLVAIHFDADALERLRDSSPPHDMLKVDIDGKVWNAGSPVWTVAVSPEGESAAVGLSDSTIRLVDLREMREIARFEGNEAEVLAVAFSKDGKRLLSGGQDRTMRLWDVGTGKLIDTMRAHSDGVATVAFSPDGRRGISGGADGMIVLWNLETGDEERWLMGHTGGVTSVAFSPSGDRILSGANDHSARIWDPETGEEKLRLVGHGTGIQGVAFSADGNRILTCSGGPVVKSDGSLLPSFDETVRMWDAATGEEIARFVGSEDWVTCVAISPDGNRIVSGSGGSLVNGKPALPAYASDVRIWEASSEREIGRSRTLDNIVRSVAFTPDGKRLVVGSWDQTVRVLTLPNPALAARTDEGPQETVPTN